MAGTLFVLPSPLLLWALTWVYAAYGEVIWIAGAFDGLKPAVLAIVIGAVLRLGRTALRNAVTWALAALAFVGIFYFGLPFPLIIAAAGLVGLIGERRGRPGSRWLRHTAPTRRRGQSSTTAPRPQGT